LAEINVIQRWRRGYGHGKNASQIVFIEANWRGIEFHLVYLRNERSFAKKK
jgi:hypothetical protein